MADTTNLTKEDMTGIVTTVVTGALEGVTKDFRKEMDAKLEEIKTAQDAATKAAADERAAFEAKHSTFGMTKNGKKDYKQTIEFLNLLMQDDRAGIKAMGLKILTAGTDSTGGYLVPEEFGTEVDEIAQNVGLARKLCRYIPMKSQTRNMPVLEQDVLTYWVGEGLVKTTSQFTLSNVKLQAYTLVGIMLLTKELLDDSDVKMVEFIAMRFAQAMAKEEDRQMLVGTGAPFVGVMNTVGINSVQMSTGNTDVDDVTIADLNAVRFTPEETIVNNARWVMHRNVLRIIQSIKENGQSIVSFCNPVITADYKGGLIVPAAILLGHEVYTSSSMPATVGVGTAFLVFGDFMYYYFGERQGRTSSLSTEATVGGVNLFEQNAVGLRIEERVGMVCGQPKAFTVLKTANS